MKLKSFIIMTSFLVANASLAQTKQTVCSVTINSSEEIEIFKRNLNPQEFNFVELTDYKASDSNSSFLNAACDAGVTCDILLISGHFAGSFFGKSDLKIPMEKLEEASCNRKCDGILHHPREVFLSG